MMTEAKIRLAFFLGGLLLFTGLGFLFPARKVSFKDQWVRMLNNIALTVVNSLLLRFVLKGGLLYLAFRIQLKGWGLFPLLKIPIPVNIILAVILQDMIIYWQHRLFHVVPLFWRLHRLHHADVEYDTTTALRFHTIEILLSVGVKALTILALGLPPVSVVIFEVILNFSAMFNHGNFSLPGWLERPVRWVLVTPDMHRIHHTTVKEEINSNYGFCLSLWDRFFRSYTEKASEDTNLCRLGLTTFREGSERRLDKMLTQPFRNDA